MLNLMLCHITYFLQLILTNTYCDLYVHYTVENLLDETTGTRKVWMENALVDFILEQLNKQAPSL